MARYYTETDKLYRAVVSYRNGITGKQQTYFYGPYSTVATAKRQVTREISEYERWNENSIRNNARPSYEDIKGWVEFTPITWGIV